MPHPVQLLHKRGSDSILPTASADLQLLATASALMPCCSAVSQLRDASRVLLCTRRSALRRPMDLSDALLLSGVPVS